MLLILLACYDPSARVSQDSIIDVGIHGGSDTSTDSDSGLDTGDTGDTGEIDTGEPEETGETGETAEELVEIEILAIEPSTVSTVGGDVVTLSGGPFGADAEVFFGGVLGTVASWSRSSLDVVTPAASEGLVDVEVTTPTGAGLLVDGLTYVEPCTGIVADPSSWSYTATSGTAETTISLVGCATGLVAEDYTGTDSMGFTYGFYWTGVPSNVDGTTSVVLRWQGTGQVTGLSTTVAIRSDQGSTGVIVSVK